MQLPPSTSALPALLLVAVKMELVPEFEPDGWVTTVLVWWVGLPTV